jgi:hypothetical protein
MAAKYLSRISLMNNHLKIEHLLRDCPTNDATLYSRSELLSRVRVRVNALACQKTSDNQGYCGANPEQKSVVTSLSLLPFLPNLGSQSTISTSQLISLNFAESDVCTDCSKNGLAAVLVDTNLSEEARFRIQNVSTALFIQIVFYTYKI